MPELHPLHHERIFTWRNAILGGVGAAGLLAAAVVAYLAMWATGIGPVGSLVAQGVIEEGEPVILADFTNSTPDSTLGGVVTAALRADLVQSPVLRLVERASLEDVLRRMQRDPSTKLTPDVAREAAQRDGIKAVLEGDVGSVGVGYILTATIRSAESGQALARSGSRRRGARRPHLGHRRALPGHPREGRRVPEEHPRRASRWSRSPPARWMPSGSTASPRTPSTEATTRPPSRSSTRRWRWTAPSPWRGASWPSRTATRAWIPRRWPTPPTEAYRHRDHLTEIERYLAEAFYNDQVTGRPGRGPPGLRERPPAGSRQPPRPQQPGQHLPGCRRSGQGGGALRQGRLRAGGLQRRVPESGQDAGGRRQARFGADGGGRVPAPATPTTTTPSCVRVWPLLELRRSTTPRPGRVPSPPTRPAPPSRGRGVSGPRARSRWRGATWLIARRLGSESVRVGAQAGPAYDWLEVNWAAWPEPLLGARAPREPRPRRLDPGRPLRRPLSPGQVPLLPGAEPGARRRRRGSAGRDPGLPGVGARCPEERRGRAAGPLRRRDDPRPGHDTVGVSSALQAVQDDEGCWTCYRTEIALAHEWMHRPARAIELHESVLAQPYALVELNPVYGAVAMLHLGPLYEEVGDTAKAIEAYRRVVDRWGNGDAEAQRYVAQARARMDALGAGG